MYEKQNKATCLLQVWKESHSLLFVSDPSHLRGAFGPTTISSLKQATRVRTCCTSSVQFKGYHSERKHEVTLLQLMQRCLKELKSKANGCDNPAGTGCQGGSLAPGYHMHRMPGAQLQRSHCGSEPWPQCLGFVVLIVWPGA